MTTPKNLFIGAGAGLAGAYAMQRFRSAWNRHYAATPEDGVFGLDKEADLKSANILTNFVLSRTLPEKNAEELALVLHYAYGALAGAAYALAVENTRYARAGCGTLFGTAVWLLGDEIPIALSGLSNPFARTTRSHGSAFAAHLLFGAATELSRAAASKLTS